MQKAIVVIIAVAMMLAGCNLVWADENAGINTNSEFIDLCEDTGATLSGPEILAKNTKIFRCEKPGKAHFILVEVKEGKPSVFVINEPLDSLLEDSTLLKEIAQFIINTGDGTGRRVWNRINMIISY